MWNASVTPSEYAGVVIEPVLEELPKWRLVCKIMQELQAEGKLVQSDEGVHPFACVLDLPMLDL